MNKAVLFSLLFAAGSFAIMAQNDYEDDIYYNPNKSSSNKKESTYIKDFDKIDVDTYNRRGQYYVTPIDTIGNSIAYGEDFVNTQQIQKFINPTIVVDNAELLSDVLDNSYGNVEIIISDNGIPTFAPIYVYNDWPLYHYTWRPWNWTWGWGPSFAISWNWGWGPSWTWGWGYDPFWAWGPSWGPGWGPGWGPMVHPGWHGGHYIANHYRPGANRPNGPAAGWANNTRPGGNRYAGGTRPGYAASTGKNNNNYRYTTGGHRVSNNSTSTTSGNRINNNNSHRGSTVTKDINSNVTNKRNYNNNNSNRSYNSRNSSNSHRSYNSGSSNRSYNRSSGGGFRSGGGGGGHRSGGGGHRR